MLGYRLAIVFSVAFLGVLATTVYADEKPAAPLRVGIIGCDTSHVPSFAKSMREGKQKEIQGLKLVAAYPGGSDDFPPSRDRVKKFTEELREQGVQIVDSIDALMPLVDVVMIESVDGRVHLEQARQVFAAKKPVFIDKPVAVSLTDAIEIFRLAKEADVPCFSSSSLRYSPGLIELESKRKSNRVLGCDAYGPYKLAPPIPDMYWYGIHTVEMLYTVMGTGCKSVSRTSADGADVVVGVWDDGRVGVYRGNAKGRPDFGVVVFGQKSITPIAATSNYENLLVEIAKFFRTGKPPVSEEVTIEICAFIEAAHESKRQNGATIELADVMAKAREQIAKQAK